MNFRKNTFLSFVLLWFIVILASCTQLTDSDDTGISISLPSSGNSRAAYQKEDSKKFRIEIKSGLVTVVDETISVTDSSHSPSKFYSLEPGLYGIAVYVYNENDILIAEGSQTVEVRLNETATAQIQLRLKEIPEGQPDGSGNPITDYLNTKFYYVRDVQWNTGSATNSYIRNSGNPWGMSDLPDGSYFMLVDTDTTQQAGSYYENTDTSKTIQVYNAIIYNSDGIQVDTYHNITIIGISYYGMMTLDSGLSGAFFYSQYGWEASNMGENELLCNFTSVYPSKSEINSLVLSAP